MRIRLFREDYATDDGRIVTKAEWSDEAVPLMSKEKTLLPEGVISIIGKVTDVQREIEGWVTGEITTEVHVVGLAAQAEFDHVDVREVHGRAVLLRPRLRAVMLGTTPCWDGLVIT